MPPLGLRPTMPPYVLRAEARGTPGVASCAPTDMLRHDGNIFLFDEDSCHHVLGRRFADRL